MTVLLEIWQTIQKDMIKYKNSCSIRAKVKECSLNSNGMTYKISILRTVVHIMCKTTKYVNFTWKTFTKYFQVKEAVGISL